MPIGGVHSMARLREAVGESVIHGGLPRGGAGKKPTASLAITVVPRDLLHMQLDVFRMTNKP